MSDTYKCDGGPAFPTQSDETPFGDFVPPQIGMTLRDYFAAKAMQASRARHSEYRSWKDLALDSYEIADAMLEARK